MYMFASPELTPAPRTRRSGALQHLLSLSFVALSMSSQSTSSRPTRNASQHRAGYYSQIADVDADDVAAADGDDDADDSGGKSKRRIKSNKTQVDSKNHVREFRLSSH